MEDQEKALEPAEENIPFVKGRRQRFDSLTVMLLRGVGKPHTFKISQRLIRWASIFFIIYIPASIFIINDYFDLQRITGARVEKIKRLEMQLVQSKSVLDLNKHRLTMLKEYIEDFTDQQEISQRSAVVNDIPKKVDVSSQKVQPIKGDRPGSSAGTVRIEDMEIKKKGSNMNLKFKVVNSQQGQEPVGGYIHIIATDKNSDPHRQWSYPEAKLTNGLPVNFRRGQLFLIKRFREIKGSCSLSPDAAMPLSVIVLIYNVSGEIILEQEFEVRSTF